MSIKCVVWDLDNTVWDGTLLEDKTVIVVPEIVHLIKVFDQRGILQSIASKNDHNEAYAVLQKNGLESYFLYPQINWNAKSHSIKIIAKKLNISIDSFAFIDDTHFELEEVRHECPTVKCFHVDQCKNLSSNKNFIPKFITEDSASRRRMYIADEHRQRLEAEFVGPKNDFLESLKMQLTISAASEKDLQRAEELTERTNQLNSTGKTYSYNDLLNFLNSQEYTLYVCELSDIHGSYGKVGLSLVKHSKDFDQIELLLTSCRVLSRGVGNILLSFLMKETQKKSKKLLATFVSTGKNKLMYVAYKFSNFKPYKVLDQKQEVLINDLSAIPPFPHYISINFQ